MWLVCRENLNIKVLKKAIFWFFLAFLLVYTQNVKAAGAAHDDDGKFNAGDVIIGHILDSYDWHIADVGKTHISIPLPVILLYQGKPYVFFSSRFDHGHSAYKGFRIALEGPKKGKIIKVLDDGLTPDPNATFLLDLSITKNVFAIFISATLLCLILIRIGRKYQREGSMAVPKGLQSFLEPLIIFVRDEIALSAIGEKHYQRFLPYLLTLFFFIFFNNLLGLVPVFPGGANVTGSISVTLVLALFTFFTTQLFSNKGYWKHIFNTPGVPVWLKLPIPLMPIIELVGVFIKPFVLMVRLFANITAGHMIILGFVSLIFVLGSVATAMGYAISPLALIFLIFMNFIELLVAFLQAYVFTLFSALFFGMAVPEEHH
jgi:F-type H+-transporting ATPase subunit a